MKLEFVKTNDDSQTLFNPELNEHYHSIHGAYQESVHVYIKSGLDHWKDKNESDQNQKKGIKVFEMGFGTGLNILLTYLCAEEHQIPVQVVTVEVYPLEKEIWSHLAYARNELEQKVFEQLHAAPWEESTQIGEYLTVTKKHLSLFDYDGVLGFDVVYFDAFGPDKQPELWEIPVFEKIYALLATNGSLVTYSAKGQVRRNMVAAGLEVERIPGPPGKREMLRATRLT